MRSKEKQQLESPAARFLDVSTTPPTRCQVCRCFLDADDLFCSNCGTENAATESREVEEVKSVARTSAAEIYALHCQSCGASMRYDATARALRCPFCGATTLSEPQTDVALQPQAYLEAKLDQARTDQVLRQWLESSFWRPSDAATVSVVSSATLVYVPFWVFTARTETNWTGDQSPPPVYTRADWYGLSGQHRGEYHDLLVLASSALSAHEIDAILPYDLSELRPLEALQSPSGIVENFTLDSDDARQQVRGVIESRERAACEGYIPGRSRNIRVNVIVRDLGGLPILAPIWITVYRYKEKSYRVVVNACTGEVFGTAPVSMLKVSLAVIAVIIAVIVALLIFFASAAG